MAEEIKFFKIKDSNAIRTTDGVYFVKSDSDEDFEIVVVDKGVKRFSKYINKTHPANSVTQQMVDNSHTHTNKSLLDSINQNLSTTSDVAFNTAYAKAFYELEALVKTLQEEIKTLKLK